MASRNEYRRACCRSRFSLKRALGVLLEKQYIALKSDGEREIIFAQQALKAVGFPVGKLVNISDAVEASSMMKDFQVDRLPSDKEQADHYDIIRKSGLHGLGSKIIRQWLAKALQVRKTIDGSIPIKLAFCLRHSGEFDTALEIVDTTLDSNGCFAITPIQKAILHTMRAAVLLDLSEIRRDPDLVKEARRSADISFAISQSDEVRSVYRRLENIRTEYNQNADNLPDTQKLVNLKTDLPVALDSRA